MSHIIASVDDLKKFKHSYGVNVEYVILYCKNEWNLMDSVLQNILLSVSFHITNKLHGTRTFLFSLQLFICYNYMHPVSILEFFFKIKLKFFRPRLFIVYFPGFFKFFKNSRILLQISRRQNGDTSQDPYLNPQFRISLWSLLSTGTFCSVRVNWYTFYCAENIRRHRTIFVLSGDQASRVFSPSYLICPTRTTYPVHHISLIWSPQ